MITKIEPERGGESQGILRVELSLPMSPEDLRSLRAWLDAAGFSPDVDQIDEWFEHSDEFDAAYAVIAREVFGTAVGELTKEQDAVATQAANAMVAMGWTPPDHDVDFVASHAAAVDEFDQWIDSGGTVSGWEMLH